MSDNEDDDRFFEDCDDLFSDKDLVTGMFLIIIFVNIF